MVVREDLFSLDKVLAVIVIIFEKVNLIFF